MHCVFFFFVKRPRFSDRDRETMKANLLRHLFFFRMWTRSVGDPDPRFILGLFFYF